MNIEQQERLFKSGTGDGLLNCSLNFRGFIYFTGLYPAFRGRFRAFSSNLVPDFPRACGTKDWFWPKRDCFDPEEGRSFAWVFTIICDTFTASSFNFDLKFEDFFELTFFLSFKLCFQQSRMKSIVTTASLTWKSRRYKIRSLTAFKYRVGRRNWRWGYIGCYCLFWKVDIRLFWVGCQLFFLLVW